MYLNTNVVGTLKGEPRWETVACFARLAMVHRGMLKKGSRRGTWEITEKGRALVR